MVTPPSASALTTDFDAADLVDDQQDEVSLEKVDLDEVDLADDDSNDADGSAAPDDGLSPVGEDFGEVLFAEQGAVGGRC